MYQALYYGKIETQTYYIYIYICPKIKNKLRMTRLKFAPKIKNKLRTIEARLHACANVTCKFLLKNTTRTCMLSAAGKTVLDLIATSVGSDN